MPTEQGDFFLFNTLSKAREPFVPSSKSRVTMYVCGPTVYDFIHLGNARSAVVYDLLYRLLLYLYGKGNVLYARNITDVDDKIIKRSQELGIRTQELVERTIKALHEDESYLQCLKPSLEPRATQYIGSMIEIIEALLNNGAAYIAQGHVFFSVKKARSSYASFAGRKEITSEQDPIKREAGDFVLWKPKKETESSYDVFESPWGLGRPGWHIECSAMSTKVLGQSFDIHGGGVDLIFPHHSNEIAQSTSAFPGSSYARFWVHTGFLTHNHEKMSKSLGNFVTVRELQSQGVQGNALRLFILNTHYRKPLDFSQRALEEAVAKSRLLEKALGLCSDSGPKEDLPSDFLKHLKDDMNTHMCIDYLHRKALSICSGQKTGCERGFQACCNFLGLTEGKEGSLSPSEITTIEALIGQRRVARANKDWSLADMLRLKLSKMGVQLEDQPDGSTHWIVKS